MAGSCCSAPSSTSSGTASAPRSAAPTWSMRPRAVTTPARSTSPTATPPCGASSQPMFRDRTQAEWVALAVEHRHPARPRPPGRRRTPRRPPARRPSDRGRRRGARRRAVRLRRQAGDRRRRAVHGRGARRRASVSTPTRCSPPSATPTPRSPPSGRAAWCRDGPADLGPHHPALGGAPRPRHGGDRPRHRRARRRDRRDDVPTARRTFGPARPRPPAPWPADWRRGGDRVLQPRRADRHRVGGAAQRAVLHADLHVADRGRVRPHRRRRRRLGDRRERRPRIAGRLGGPAVRHAGAGTRWVAMSPGSTVVRRARCRGRRSARRRGRGVDDVLLLGHDRPAEGDAPAAARATGAVGEPAGAVPSPMSASAPTPCTCRPAPLYHAAPLGWSLGRAHGSAARSW